VLPAPYIFIHNNGQSIAGAWMEQASKLFESHRKNLCPFSTHLLLRDTTFSSWLVVKHAALSELQYVYDAW